MKYGINLTWNELQKDPQALELVRQYDKRFVLLYC